jgi:hypothetical protein
MYWIASYPRSGNTFLRILFKEVYGLKTWEGYGDESPKKVIEHNTKNKISQYTFIKTHELPSKTEIPYNQLKSIYLVRDGRDAAVSMAYHRSQIVKPGSDYIFNLRTAILAPFKTSFGGWSKNVEDWSSIADIVIKFEDLISNPKAELQRLEKIIKLPTPNYEKIPTFKDLKSKNFDYGSGGDKLDEKQRSFRRNKFFRSGKTGNWKQDMPFSLQKIFNQKNAKMLELYGYENNDKSKITFVNSIYQHILWFIGYLKEKFKR